MNLNCKEILRLGQVIKDFVRHSKKEFVMNRSENVFVTVLGYLALAAILVVVSAFIVTAVWGMIVPTVFAGAVEKGALPASLTLMQAFKLSIMFSIVGVAGSSKSSSSKKSSSSSSSNGGCLETLMVSLIAFVIMLPIWAILVAISGFFVHLVWGWVIPDVFAGAVELNLLPAQLSVWHAILVTALIGILGLKK